MPLAPGGVIKKIVLVEDGESGFEFTAEQLELLGFVAENSQVVENGKAGWFFLRADKDNAGPIRVGVLGEGSGVQDPDIPEDLHPGEFVFGGLVENITEWSFSGDEFAAAPNQYKLHAWIGLPKSE